MPVPSLTPESHEAIALLRQIKTGLEPLSAELAVARRENATLTMRVEMLTGQVAALEERVTALWENHLENRTTMDQLRGLRDKIWAIGLAAALAGATAAWSLPGLLKP